MSESGKTPDWGLNPKAVLKLKVDSLQSPADAGVVRGLQEQRLERMTGLNSLAISSDEVKAALVTLSQHDDVLAAMARRSARRFELADGCRVVLGYTPTGGTTLAVVPVIRDVSRDGLSMLYTAFIRPGTGVVCLFMSSPGQPSLRVTGEVVRCRHVRGLIFELGIRFKEPAAIYRFVSSEVERPLSAAPPNAAPYASVLAALKWLDSMARDGAPLEMIEDGVRDIELAVRSERQLRTQATDDKSIEIDVDDLDPSGA